MSTAYGQSYTDKKTQSAMMRFLKQSNKFTGNRRLGKAKPVTQLNRDKKPATDFFDNPQLQRVSKGSPVGSNKLERVSEKPKRISARYESQKNNYKPRSKKATGRPRNTSSINRRYK